jgi:hypothetical protein
MPRHPFLLLAILSALAGCDQLGLEAASVTAARVEADGKAVGAACRHGGRAIEDCFALNRKVDKAAIYAGWREMDDYMRENKIEAVLPTLGAGGKAKMAEADDAASAAPPPASTAKADATADKPADKVARIVPPKADKVEKIARIDKSAAEKPADH